MRFPLLVLLVLTPLAAAHGEDETTTGDEVETPVADVIVVHKQEGDAAACRVTVQGHTRPFPQTTHVGRACPAIPHLD